MASIAFHTGILCLRMYQATNGTQASGPPRKTSPLTSRIKSTPITMALRSNLDLWDDTAAGQAAAALHLALVIRQVRERARIVEQHDAHGARPARVGGAGLGSAAK